MHRPRVVVFARAPAMGVGKSRLARDVGSVEAWRLYRNLSARTLWRLADPRWALEVAITPDRAEAGGAPLGWPKTARRRQGGGGLGVRLERVFAGASGPVAVVGTDAPEISRALIGAAFSAVRRSGAAVGPAEDGGFWLLALNARRARRLDLSGVRWSGPHALADTLERIGPATRLPMLIDIDDGRDLARWRASLSDPSRR